MPAIVINAFEVHTICNKSVSGTPARACLTGGYHYDGACISLKRAAISYAA
jgi:hypothetical protein